MVVDCGRGMKMAAAVVLLLAAAPLAFAQSPTPPSAAAGDVAAKLCTIVSFVQYVAGAVGVLVLGVLGVQFMTTTSSNPQKRDELKTQMAMALTGLFVILIAKSLVGLILPNIAATC